jgi:hypothetical protein
MTNGAVDVTDCTAQTAHDVMMVIVDTSLVKSGGSNWLDASKQAFFDQDIEGVVDGLT